MIDLYRNIKKLREARNMSQETLAKLTGYTDRSSIAKIEKGLVDLQQSKVELFAKALGTTARALMGWEPIVEPLPPFPNVRPLSTSKLPVLGYISCGEPKFMLEEMEYYTVEGIEVKADYILVARGDSMVNARIEDGDLVFIRKQPMVENGEIAAVAIGEEATLKRVYYYKEKSTLILKPENPKYEDLVFIGQELEEVRILGKAIGFQGNIR